MGTVGERRDASHQTMTDDKAAGGESGNVHGRGGWRAWRRPGGDSGWAEQRQAARGGGPCGGVVQIKALARDVPSATPAGARATVGVRGGGVAAGARRCFYQEWPTWWRCWQLSRGALSPAKLALAGRFSSFPCCLTRAAKKTKGGGGKLTCRPLRAAERACDSKKMGATSLETDFTGGNDTKMEADVAYGGWMMKLPQKP